MGKPDIASCIVWPSGPFLLTRHSPLLSPNDAVLHPLSTTRAVEIVCAFVRSPIPILSKQDVRALLRTSHVLLHVAPPAVAQHVDPAHAHDDQYATSPWQTLS
ncbi:hypothetical protein CEXT_442121 [Caerostris extrusa]|uniref:Uncharacterized protein n=1 Tax=Caerostris extrusa TaxID=172846 RepID=A0AAV4WP91_CAEEX|nr:hypothetical protein CEXT_442121 [Caerostris extrusa]